jgi:hypothetical protein
MLGDEPAGLPLFELPLPYEPIDDCRDIMIWSGLRSKPT